MSNSRTITIKNPSRKLEEHIRKIGVQKYLWIEQLCSDETKPTKTIHVWWQKSIPSTQSPSFFHLIYHRQHLHYAEMIAEGHAKDFGKPEEE